MFGGGGHGPDFTPTKVSEIEQASRSLAGEVQFPPVSFVYSFSSPFHGLFWTDGKTR
jgi:hypothetical protein